MKKNVLFICTHNAIRSQIAQGYLNTRYGDRFAGYSAGSQPTSVHPLAIEVMAEIGIDISGHRSRDLKEFFGQEMDIVVTMCDSEKGACPMYPWTKKIVHMSFSAPSSIQVTRIEPISEFRQIRDEITTWLEGYFGPGGEGT